MKSDDLESLSLVVSKIVAAISKYTQKGGEHPIIISHQHWGTSK